MVAVTGHLVARAFESRRDITISAFLLTAFSGRRGDPGSLPR
jgi:hypothetical protein